MPRWPQHGDGDWIWALKVEWPSRVLVWTSRPVEPSGLDGEVMGFVEFPSIQETLDLNGKRSRQVISCEVHWPADDPVARGEAAGVRIAGVPAEVALVPMTSGAWDHRYVVVRDFVAKSEYGDADEPVAFDVRRYEEDDRSVYPLATWVVDELTFPTTDDSAYLPPGL
jgi:hypothetical protein